MRLLILEDEIHAATKLKSLIRDTEAANTQTATIDWAQSITEGKDLIFRHKYDIIFSDIELLDGNVFELYKTIIIDIPIIFCTAYDHFYIDAFQSNGIAYLLKPYSKSEFDQAWRKYSSLFQPKSQTKINKDLAYQLTQLQLQAKPQYKSTFIAKKRNESYVIKTNQITHYTANGEYVKAIDSAKKIHILHLAFGELASCLNPDHFFQINRSEIINRSFIANFKPYIKNRLAIIIQGNTTVFYTSNSRSSLFKKWIEKN